MHLLYVHISHRIIWVFSKGVVVFMSHIDRENRKVCFVVTVKSDLILDEENIGS